MSWIIQSLTEGPVIISDIGLTLTHRQIKDVDLIGRDNAERSNDLKILLNKGFLKEIKKDAAVTGASTEAVQHLSNTMAQAVTATNQTHAAQQAQSVEIEALKKKTDENTVLTLQVLDEVKKFAEKFPLDSKVFAEAMRNAVAERENIAAKKDELTDSGMSEAEIKTQDRILKIKDKKLEKNIRNIGDTISHKGSDIDETLDALDELNL